MNGPVTASAPGKIILFGEHAVVSGEPAVATCVSLRTWCRVERAAEEVVQLELASLGGGAGPLRCTWPLAAVRELAAEQGLGGGALPELSPVLQEALVVLASRCGAVVSEEHARGVAAFLLLFTVFGAGRSGGVAAHVWSTLPVGAGLGSSAAFSASVCGALSRWAGVRFCEQNQAACEAAPCAACRAALNERTFLAERVLHGSPSGIDNSVAVHGGALSFVRGRGVVVLPAMPLLPLLLVDTGVPRSTQALVSGVLRRRDTFPEVMGPALAAIGHISRSAIALFGGAEAGETAGRAAMLQQIGTLIDMNQGLLECIGVSHPSIRQVINATAPCKWSCASYCWSFLRCCRSHQADGSGRRRVRLCVARGRHDGGGARDSGG
jgi:mevalonate kinase